MTLEATQTQTFGSLRSRPKRRPLGVHNVSLSESRVLLKYELFTENVERVALH